MSPKTNTDGQMQDLQPEMTEISMLTIDQLSSVAAGADNTASAVMHMSASSHMQSARTTGGSAHYHVSVQATPQGTSDGLAKVLEIMQQSTELTSDPGTPTAQDSRIEAPLMSLIPIPPHRS